MMLVRKPIIIKMLKNEQNIIKFLEKFVSFFKLTQ